MPNYNARLHKHSDSHAASHSSVYKITPEATKTHSGRWRNVSGWNSKGLRLNLGSLEQTVFQIAKSQRVNSSASVYARARYLTISLAEYFSVCMSHRFTYIYIHSSFFSCSIQDSLFWRRARMFNVY